jgi:hypothetical protein
MSRDTNSGCTSTLIETLLGLAVVYVLVTLHERLQAWFNLNKWQAAGLIAAAFALIFALIFLYRRGQEEMESIKRLTGLSEEQRMRLAADLQPHRYQVVERRYDASSASAYIRDLENPDAPLKDKLQALFDLANLEGRIWRRQKEQLQEILTAMINGLDEVKEPSPEQLLVQSLAQKAHDRLKYVKLSDE